MSETPRRPPALLLFNTASRPDLITGAQLQRLAGIVELLHPAPIATLDDARLPGLLARTEILLTGWRAPPIGARVLELAPELRLVAHLAGTVKGIVDPVVWQRGVAVVNAVAANAIPVAEFTLAALLFGNKQAFRLQRLYRERRRMLKPWSEAAPDLGNYHKVIGIVGASRIGRRVIALLQPFDFSVLVYDPYLDAAAARAMGAEKAELDELMRRSDAVSLHAPAIPATRGMIDRRRLALLRDGALLVNTARGALVDQAALIDETRSGRIDAIIDVTEPDTLPADSPLYDIPNVFLTPHIAGAQARETERMVELVFAEIARFIRGERLQHQVAADELERLA